MDKEPRIIAELKEKVPFGLYRIKSTGQDAIPVAYAENGTIRAAVRDLGIDYWYNVFGLYPEGLEQIEAFEWDGVTIPPDEGLNYPDEWSPPTGETEPTNGNLA